MIPTWRLRAAFAHRLSDMYGTEVPAYTTLLDVAGEVNHEAARENADAERLGSIERVTAERHGAIRVGTPQEMRQAAQIFAALGMHPAGFYDLRDAASSAIPVISTAFRPLDAAELARNPFRVFTSLLTPADRRFFDADLQARLETFLSRREIFAPELLDLAHRAEHEADCPGNRPNASSPWPSPPSNCPPNPSTRPGMPNWNASPPSPPTSAACPTLTSTTSPLAYWTSTGSTGAWETVGSS